MRRNSRRRDPAQGRDRGGRESGTTTGATPAPEATRPIAPPELLAEIPPDQGSLGTIFVGLATFLSTIDGLRDLLEHASAGLAELDERALTERLEPLRRRTVDLLPVEKQPAAGAAIETWMQALVKTAESGTIGPETFTQAQRDMASLVSGFENSPVVQELVLGFYTALLERSRGQLLRRAALNAAVAAFEAHVAGVIAEFFRREPRMLAEIEQNVRVTDLLDADSIGTIVDGLTERAVQSVIQRGYKGWATWLQPRIKAKVDNLAMDADATAEIFARRNLYAHSGGAVTRRYREATGTAIDLGRELDLDDDYLMAALDRLAVLGITLAVAARRQLAPDLPRLGIDISVRTVEHLMHRGRWAAALRACEVEQDLAETEDDRLVARVNVWLARKHLSGLASIRRGVEAWNVSRLRPFYRLVQLALLDDNDAALRLARELADEHIVDETIIDWPLFAGMRPSLVEMFRDRRESSRSSRAGNV